MSEFRAEDFINRTVTDMKPSGIRKFFDVVNEMEGAISLGVGEPDFVTPWHIREAGIYSLEKGRTHYSANAGLLELRQEICKYVEKFDLHYDPASEVTVTVGGSEGVDLAIRTIIGPGDEVLIPEPSFVCYHPCVALAGGTPVGIVTKAENEFKLTRADVEERLSPNTKLLILSYPNNPTGAIMTREDLEPIAQLAIEHNFMVLSDEIYAELTYGGQHVSIASLPGMRERTFVVNGFSKAYAMTGWRLGYLMADKAFMQQTAKIHQYAIMCSPSVSQFAAVEALKNGADDVACMREEYDCRRKLIVDGFNRMGLTCFDPRGAFYIFPSIQSTGMTSEQFCEELLQDQKLAVVPGTAFGESGEGFVRVSYAYSVDQINEAMERIAAFLHKRGLL